ncbi:MAG TPA: hypothetical protein ENH41_03335 [Candidatus Omnitrophica bacterium]|nr:hypothetical protein [Candidatus Omnitrophota bacterium]
MEIQKLKEAIKYVKELRLLYKPEGIEGSCLCDRCNNVRPQYVAMSTLISLAQSIINISDSGVLPEEKEIYKPTNEQVGNGAYYDLRERKGHNACRNEMLLKQAKVEVMSVDEIRTVLIEEDEKADKRNYEAADYGELATAINKELIKRAGGEK